jgi:hypothetical protein
MGSRQPSNTKPEITAKQQADDRLAQALRDNLHRRKAQMRARANSDIADAAEMPMTAAPSVAPSAAPSVDSDMALTDDSDQNKK